MLAGHSVDLYNPKTVRASVGSLFHLPVATGASPAETADDVRRAGLTLLAADGAGELDLFEAEAAGLLAGPTAWLFGNEAWGLPDGGGGAGRPPGPHPDLRRGREPQPGHRGRGLPLHQRPRPARRSPPDPARRRSVRARRRSRYARDVAAVRARRRSGTPSAAWLARPSQAASATIRPIVTASVSPAGSYHSVSELTMPNTSREATSGATSERTLPSSTAARDQARQPRVDAAAARQRLLLGVAVAPHPQHEPHRRAGGRRAPRRCARPSSAGGRRRCRPAASAASSSASSAPRPSSRAVRSRCSLVGTWW